MQTDFTVGELLDHLKGFPEDAQLTFSGGFLNFYRLKMRGDNLVDLEFSEAQADLSPEFRKDNPHVKVAFISLDDVEWDESGVLGGPIDVSVR